jgi:hypothetical protein
MDDENEDDAAHRAWVRWMNGDTGMPVWGVALMHDLVLCFYREASGHERLAMIGQFPILIEAYNVVFWVAETFHIADPRIVAFLEQMPPEQRLELTALRAELERYLLHKRGVIV